MSSGVQNHTHLNFTPEQPLEFAVLGLVVVPLTATVGNALVLVCIAVNQRIRANCTNHYIASLAASDFLIGSLVMPFAVYLMVNHGAWLAGELCCQAYLAIDVAASTASILNLLLIAFDRFCAIMRAATYQQTWQNLKRARTVIVGVWVLSGSLLIPLLTLRKSSPPGEKRCDFDSPDFMIYSSLLSFYLPAFIILSMYGVIFRHLKKRVTTSLVMRNRCSTNSFGDSNSHKATAAAHTTATVDSQAEETTKLKSDDRESHQPPPRVTINNDSADIPSPNPFPNLPVLKATESKASFQKRCVRRHTTCNIQVNTGRRLSLYHNEDSGSTDSEEDRLVLRAGMGMSRRMQARKLVRRVTSGIQTRLSLARKSSSFRKEKKATKLVAIVVGCFLACWLPFFTMQMYRGICLKLGSCGNNDQVSAKFFLAASWLGYLNSALNPILYTVFNEAFRDGMKKIITCQCINRAINL